MKNHRPRGSELSWPGRWSRTRPRLAFTLVELMVVIMVLAILIALVVIAGGGAMRTAEDAREVNDMTQIAAALERFKDKYGIYPPSRIRLREGTPYDLADPFDAHSVRYLKRIWPQIGITVFQSPQPPQPVLPQNRILWVFDGSKNLADPTTWNGIYELEGDECLVFFLGGIQEFNPLNPSSAIQLHGFSTRPTNPGGIPNNIDPSSTRRDGPYFQFEPSRLTFRQLQGGSNVLDDEVVLDQNGVQNELQLSFGVGPAPANITPTPLATGRTLTYRGRLSRRPYAYFSAYEGEGYRPGDVNLFDNPAMGAAYYPGQNLQWFFQNNFVPPVNNLPAPTVSLEPNPYTETALPNNPGAYTSNIGRVQKWINPQSFQLIAPGRDGKYGPGGQLPRRTQELGQPNTDLNPGGASADNFANFAGGSRLGDFNTQQQSSQ